MLKAERLTDEPIIHPELSPTIGGNNNGPSLIRVPEWVRGALGRYYLYFAHHQGEHIRLAYADALTGPWRIHEPGVLHVGDSGMVGHVASPDVHVDDAAREVRMYYHGPIDPRTPVSDPALEAVIPSQWTRAAVSGDGLAFGEPTPVLAKAYLRAFWYDGRWWAVTMPGLAFRGDEVGLRPFVAGPYVFEGEMPETWPPPLPCCRHLAVRVRGEVLDVLFTRIGDAPERIMHGTIDLSRDWRQWRIESVRELLRPERAWEGAELPVHASHTGAVNEPVHALRDPAIHEEDGRTYLLYCVAGESGIAIAELHDH